MIMGWKEKHKESKTLLHLTGTKPAMEQAKGDQ